MFPGLRQRFDAALDLIVEFSTLGEYRLAAPAVAGRPSAPQRTLSGRTPRLGGAGDDAARAADEQVAQGAVVIARGAAGRASLRGTAATPAARRLAARRHVSSSAPSRVERRVRLGSPTGKPRSRAGAPEASEQLCLAV